MDTERADTLLAKSDTQALGKGFRYPKHLAAADLRVLETLVARGKNGVG